jgi:hypothetical protein
VSEKTNRKENRKFLWKRKQLGIPFCGTKIEAILSECLSENPSAEEKTTLNSFPWN